MQPRYSNVGRGTRASNSSANDSSRNFKEELTTLKRKVARLYKQAEGIREHTQEIASAAPPDTLPSGTRLHATVDSSRCNACRMCQKLCPEGAIRVSIFARINRTRCTGCGICVQNCPQGALSLVTQ